MIDTPFLGILNKQYMFGAILIVVVISLSIGIVHRRYENRLLYSELQKHYENRDKLQDSWSQLLLEHGMWASDVRVERVAYENLGMVSPKKTQVIKP